jgi:hypothetical protein
MVFSPEENVRDWFLLLKNQTQGGRQSFAVKRSAFPGLI